MIREATLEDIPTLMSLAREFGSQAYPPEMLTFDEEKSKTLLYNFITSDDYLVLTWEGGGFVGGLVDTLYFKEKLATELSFYASPDSRKTSTPLRVLKQFEDWAAIKGAKAFVFHLVGRETSGAFLERAGYRLEERAYVKCQP